MFEDSIDMMGGELVIVMPQGTTHSAVVSDNRFEREINDTGNIVSVERINVYFPKGETVVTMKNRIQARGKLWRIEDLGDDEIAWNLGLAHIRK